MAAMLIAAGALYRFSTYLIAFEPGPEWTYFPSVPEFLVTAGLVAAELLGYIILVKKFPILRGRTPARSSPSSSPATEPTDGRLRPTMSAVAVTLALVALLLATVKASGQTGGGATPDRQCLTRGSELCLPEPVSLDEPHGALCATCHDLVAQARPAEAVSMCASGGCHERADTLTSMHRGLPSGVLENCVRCHDPHNAPIPGSGEALCAACHVGGVRYDRPRSYARDPLAGGLVVLDLTFRHRQHEGVACTSCHGAERVHARLDEVTSLTDCRRCHHTQPLASDCLRCHERTQVHARAVTVERVMDIRLGSIDRPTRSLPFHHDDHERFACETCHNQGLELSATGADCSACHAAHHEPSTNCMACHPPDREAHDRNAHLTCSGPGCHEHADATVLLVPRTRSVCLVCHQDRADHEPGEVCVECHALPRPRPAAPGPDDALP
jgi:predicted CXXCH cytochrome family protein